MSYLKLRLAPGWHYVRMLKYKATAQGLVVPDSHNDTRRCEILTSGDGRILENGERRPMFAQPGDVVHVNPFALGKGGAFHASRPGEQDETFFIDDGSIFAVEEGQQSEEG